MQTVTTIGLDIAKSVFQVHGIDAAGNVVIRVATMSEPTKGLDARIREHRIAHDGNPVLGWCISNVVGHCDFKDNVFPRKELPENKIDAAIGAIMALGHQILSEEDLPTIYKDETLLVF